MKWALGRHAVSGELGLATSSKALWVGATIVGILIIVALIIPPISLPTRFSRLDETSGQIVLAAGGGSSSAAGLTIEVRAGSLDSDITLKVQREAPEGQVQSLPKDVSAASAVFEISPARPVVVPATVAVALREVAQPGDNLDIFALEDGAWIWASGAVLTADGRTARGSLDRIPAALVVGRISPQKPSIAGWLAPKSGLDAVARETVDVIDPLWHVANDDGSLSGPLTALPSGKFAVYPTIQNVTGGSFNGETVNRILRTDEVRKRHASTIVNLVKQNVYSGIDLNYQGVDPSLRDKLTEFVSDLATLLHQEKRSLSLVLPLPQKDAGGWNTGAYDWKSLGRLADYVAISSEKDQSINPSLMPEVLSFATSQIDRRRLNLMVSVLSHEKSKTGIRDLTLAEALETVSKIEVKGNSKPTPGETVTLYAPNLLPDSGASGIAWNNDTRTVSYSYVAADGQRTVWIENSFSLAYKLQYVRQFNLRGISVQNLGDSAADKDIAAALQSFKATGSAQLSIPNDKALSVAWKSSDGSLSASGSGWTNWAVPRNPGATYTLTLLVGDGITSVVGTKTLAVASPPTHTATPTPRPSATPTSRPTATGPSPTAVVAPTDTPATPTAVPDTPTPVRVAPPGGVRYPGVGYGMQVDQGTNLPRALQMARAAGFNWAKVQIRWDSVEPSKGNINWGYLDGIVNQMAANGIRVLFSVVAAPRWSIPSDYTDAGPPRDPQDLANFVGQIAARYPGRVNAYEIWNEENVYHEWGGKGRRIDAGKYVELLRASYLAIKSADPTAVVVSGGLTPTGFNDGDTAYDDVVYMDMMYQAGVKDYSDAIGVHGNVVMPYAANLASGANGDHGSFYFRRFEELRAVMERYGDDGKQMWFTEFGWPSSSENLWRFPRATQISEAQQAEWLVQAFQLAKDRGYVGGMFLWNLNFAPSAEPDDQWGKAAFGVLHRDWSPRPAYNALAAMPK